MGAFDLPKKRTPGINIGEFKADSLLSLDAPWLRKRRFGVTIIKREDKIDMRAEVSTDDPYLWSAFEATRDGQTYAYGMPTVTAPAQRQRARPWTFQVRTGDAYPFVEEPFRYPAQSYVGGDYVVRLSVINHNLFASDPIAPDADRTFGYLTWARYRSPVVQVVSESTGNEAGKDISFVDKTFLTLAGSGVFATGWNAAAGGYGFGWTGRHIPTTSGEAAAMRIDCMFGSTATRKVQLSTVETAPVASTRYSPPYVLGNGKVAMLAVVPDKTEAASSIYLRKSLDHGATWSTQALPELQPYQFHYTDAALVEKWNHLNLYNGDVRSLLSPIGGGRVALVLLCSKEQGRTWTQAEIDAEEASNFNLGGLSCWRFFISDNGGANFINKPWPLDESPGIRLSREGGGLDGVDMRGLHPSVEYSRLGIGNSILSAGPGSFFMCVGQWPNESPDYAPFNADSLRMLWTIDYGATWALSELLPEDGITPDPQGFHPLGQTSFSISRPAIVRPLTLESSGGLYFEGIRALPAPDEAGNTWLQTVYRTDARFSSFTKVATNRIGGTTLAKPFGTSPPPGYMASPVYVGNKAPGTLYPPRVRPGYPEFERPPI